MSSSTYVIGQITIKNPDLWEEYRAKATEALQAWNAELVCRGKQVANLSGLQPHSDVVVIRFASVKTMHDWFLSPTYQALIPLREQAADVILTAYET